MGGISEYEHLQIDALLRRGRGSAIDPESGTFLMSDNDRSRTLFDVAVLPAMRKNGLNADATVVLFDSSSALADVHKFVMAAEVIVADVSQLNPDLWYVLGLCHGLGRCPILIALHAIELPFNMPELRCVEYRPTEQGLYDLREELVRVIRVFLAAARATRE